MVKKSKTSVKNSELVKLFHVKIERFLWFRNDLAFDKFLISHLSKSFNIFTSY